MNSLIGNFQFCPKCKTPLKHSGQNLIYCSKCCFHFYLAPALTTALILENNKGEILLTKRRFSPKKNYWDLPGGFIDFKESAEASLRREIKEELNIKLGKVKYLGSYWSYYPYKKIRYQTLCLAFRAKYDGQKIIIKDDVTDYRFFPKKEINLKKISFDDVRTALKDYLRLST